MTDRELVALLDGPQPWVDFDAQTRRRWARQKLVTATHDHTEGAFLHLTEAGEAVAKTTALLRAALTRHPDLVTAFADPTFGVNFVGWSNTPRKEEDA